MSSCSVPDSVLGTQEGIGHSARPAVHTEVEGDNQTVPDVLPVLGIW